MNRKSLKELRQLVLQDIECSKDFLSKEYIKKDQNPQIIEMKIKEQTRLEAMEDVFAYITKGEKYGFRKE